VQSAVAVDRPPRLDLDLDAGRVDAGIAKAALEAIGQRRRVLGRRGRIVEPPQAPTGGIA
jgi:hypothetical protein